MIIEYDYFADELEKIIYRDAKANLIRKIANNPDRYVGLFRTTSPEIKLVQNITQSHEISFGDFLENIVTTYLGKYYTNLQKRNKYNGEDINIDQLFFFGEKVFLIEQKVRDDHDSTKKRGQFDNFKNKIDFLKQEHPDKKIEASMWFVDNSLKKNKNYYEQMMNLNSDSNVNMNLFYGDELFYYIDKIEIWNELVEHLKKWKKLEANKIELNFEKNWEETKEELKQNITKSVWSKLLSNQEVVDKILPILFPTGKYTELLD